LVTLLYYQLWIIRRRAVGNATFKELSGKRMPCVARCRM
jgi:hypothetical protein